MPGTLRAPLAHPVKIADLRPCQMTVGLREVAGKVKLLRKLKPHDEGDFIERHVVPVVRGAKERLYLIDHHHLARALLHAGQSHVRAVIVLDLARLDKQSFLTFMDNRNLLHPYDEHGKRRALEDMPRSIDKLADDPYRSLAGALRRAGGFAKDTTPFSEFLWASYLRPLIARKQMEDDFKSALAAALKLARHGDSDHLPGWCGPVEHE
jgi:hypothetical protein